ncbi:hypothetical protein COCNU_03G004360 [Cocos nucifera]|uniref:Cysteine protease n=1 Tax=Cocos nucifera TaxID=13894 RepID=A0A8K0MY06_COCNU|nr:hypothetical protein COCNU_03G004360 [Cocos nucifera]
MARLLAILFLSLAILAGANDAFDEANLIRSVTDRIDSLETSLLGFLGQTRNALHFARFAHRYGKRYQSVEEIKLRFAIFMENLDLIRSTNRKGLPYKLGINRYADMSWEEFRASRLGAAQNCSATLKGNHKMTNEELPETGAEDELLHAVGLVRPVSVAFEVVSGFRFYKGGVYTSDTCGRTQMDVNHAVLAVGYGVENGVPYWLIKNSWGEEWGVDGYFKMELGKNMCGEYSNWYCYLCILSYHCCIELLFMEMASMADLCDKGFRNFVLNHEK